MAGLACACSWPRTSAGSVGPSGRAPASMPEAHERTGRGHDRPFVEAGEVARRRRQQWPCSSSSMRADPARTPARRRADFSRAPARATAARPDGASPRSNAPSRRIVVPRSAHDQRAGGQARLRGDHVAARVVVEAGCAALHPQRRAGRRSTSRSAWPAPTCFSMNGLDACPRTR